MRLFGAPQGVPGGSPDVIPTVDSSLRYANVFKFAVGPVIWSQLGHIEQSPAVSFAAATIAFGGLARLRSWQQRGRPHPITVGAIALETIGGANPAHVAAAPFCEGGLTCLPYW